MPEKCLNRRQGIVFLHSLHGPFVPFPCLLPQQFRARGRGWGRGNYSGNNSSSSNNDFQKRNREEEWDPEYTPKSKKYYLVCVWGQPGRARGPLAHTVADTEALIGLSGTVIKYVCRRCTGYVRACAMA